MSITRIALLILCFGLFSTAHAEVVNLFYSGAPTPQSNYATRKLTAALEQRGFTVASGRDSHGPVIRLSTNPARLSSEEFSITPKGRAIAVIGGDNRGMIYGTLALAEQLRNGVRLQDVVASHEKPRLPFRAIKFNLPWSTYRPSSALDQHYDTARDLKYWEAFLDMMVEDRFNTITLWNLDPFDSRAVAALALARFVTPISKTSLLVRPGASLHRDRSNKDVGDSPESCAMRLEPSAP